MIILRQALLLCSLALSADAFSPLVHTHRHRQRQRQSIQSTVELKAHDNEFTTTSSSSASASASASSRRDWFTQSSSAAAAAAVIVSTQRPQIANAADAITDTDTDAPTVTSTSNPLCDPSVSTFKNPSKNRIVHLLGTAHISSSSAEVAGQLVRQIKPSAVFVELDAKRVGRAIPKPNPETWPAVPPTDGNSSVPAAATATAPAPAAVTANAINDAQATLPPPTSSSSSSSIEQPSQPTLSKPNPFDIREKILRKGSQVVGNSIKGLYSKLESEGFSAGEEFVVAVREGLAVGSKIILGDRDVEVTLRRLTEALAKTDLKKLLAQDSELEENMKGLLPNTVKPDQLENGGSMSKEQLSYFVETVKAKENVRLIMSNLKSVSPEIYNALVAERDVFMAEGMDRLDQFESIVAVVGIAHVDGIENTLRSKGWEEVKISCPAL